MQPQTQTPTRWRKTLVVVLILAVLAAIAISVFRAPRTLVSYTSPPIDKLGRRAKVMVPKGWRISASESHLPHGNFQKGERLIIVFRPKTNALLRWFHRIFRVKEGPEPGVYLEMGIDLPLLSLSRNTPTNGSEHVIPANPSMSYRTIRSRSPTIYGVTSFSTSDNGFFEAFHSRICGSFRIE